MNHDTLVKTTHLYAILPDNRYCNPSRSNDCISGPRVLMSITSTFHSSVTARAFYTRRRGAGVTKPTLQLTSPGSRSSSMHVRYPGSSTHHIEPGDGYTACLPTR